MSEERKEVRPASTEQNQGRFGSMDKPVEKPKNFQGTLRRLIGYFGPQKYALLLVVITAILGTAFNIVGPKVLGLATTRLFEGVIAKYQAAIHHLPTPAIDFGYIGTVLLILLGLYVISSIFSYIQQYVMAGVAQRTIALLRQQVDEKLSRLPIKYFDAHSHGEIMSRAVNDVDNLSNTLQQSITQLITSVVTLVGVIILMLTISPLLSLVIALTLPLSLLVTIRVSKSSQTYFRKQQKTLGELNGHVEEMYSGHTIVQAFGYEEESIEEFNKRNDELYDAGWRAQFVSGMIMPLMKFIGNIGYVVVAVVGSILVTQRAISIGDVQAMIQYAQQFTQPITQLANIANVIQSALASAERIFDLLDQPEEFPETISTQVFKENGGEVQFQHVKFGYQEDEMLMEDMNINVKAGQMVAIVGPTGAGKTTLVNLLMRFYEVNDGTILVDGVPINDMKRDALRRIFGMVLQDTWLFSGTIAENIAYGHEQASEEEIVQAAKMANADHFIRTLPQGYNTVLNEEASNISSGQKQLLTIARAFLADPEILILDEATSSVDTRTEMLIQKAMSELMKERTSFVIAHRLSTIRDADLILVMNHGTIIEQGTHEELLAKNGFYADLYNSQFTGRTLVKELV